MSAVTDLASLCEAAGFEPDDLVGSTDADLAELFEEFGVKGKAKIQVKKELRLLSAAPRVPDSTLAATGREDRVANDGGAAAAVPAPSSASLPSGGSPRTLTVQIDDGVSVTLGKQIGKGGTGIVFRGTLVEGAHSQDVAIKTIADGALPHELAAFQKELQTLRRIALRCDGVCKMFGHAEHGGRLYLVMKLYGSSLDEHLRQTGPLAPRKVVELGLQLVHTVSCSWHSVLGV